MSTDLSRITRTTYETNVAVTETCACGASVEFLRAFKQPEQLAEWRANHRHDMAAAIEREKANVAIALAETTTTEETP